MADTLLSRLVSPFFVLTWSTGFVVARFGLPYAEPATFLVLRFIGVLIIMVPLALMVRSAWPTRAKGMHMAVAGVLLQAGYLGGVWAAIKLGMGAGLAALIVGMQPVLTAVLGQWLGDRPNARQWAGLALGLVGVGLVVGNRLGNELTPASLSWAILGLLSITAGTIYQRRFCPAIDLRVGSALQFGAALVVTLPFAFLFETREVMWTPQFTGALAWSVLALSIGSVSLLFLLIRRGAATRVASLMYLTPGVTAVMAWMLFGEALTAVMILGLVISAVGVAWATGKR